MLHRVVLIRGTPDQPDAGPLAVAPVVLYQPPCLQLPSSFACQPHGKANDLGPRYYPSLGFYTTLNVKNVRAFGVTPEKMMHRIRFLSRHKCQFSSSVLILAKILNPALAQCTREPNFIRPIPLRYEYVIRQSIETHLICSLSRCCCYLSL